MTGKKRKNNLLLDVRREIRYSRKRFLSLFLLSALAVAFLSGLRTTAPDMEYTADLYYKAQNLMDLQLVSTVGWSEENLKEISEIEGVRQAEGEKRVDATYENLTVSMLSLPEKISLPKLTEGRLPSAAGECAAEARMMERQGLQVGDQITVSPGGTDEDTLEDKNYTIVGSVDSPMYISLTRGSSSIGTGQVSGVIFILPEEFKNDYYTNIYLTLADTAELSAYTDAYDEAVDGFTEQIQEQIEKLSTDRAEKLRTDGEKELADAEDTYQEAVENTDESLKEAKQELTDARAQLDDGWAEYEKYKDQGLTFFTLRSTLMEKETQYREGLHTYQRSEETARARLSAAKEKIDEAREELEDLGDGECYLLTRNENIGYAGYQSDAERMGNLAKVFPVIFFLVAALATLTTVTRMVEENRSEIGSLKALGFSGGQVAVKYLGYTMAASASGGVLGAIAGCLSIPQVIFGAWGMMYTLPAMTYRFQPGICLIAVVMAVLASTGTAALTCMTTLRESPASLMRPRAPKPGHRVWLEHIPFIWKRLSFITKVTVRNLFRYKQRFWMTVIGIMGCTALLTTGFGLHDSIFDILTKQYDEISCYNATVGLADDVTAGETGAAEDVLEESSDVAAWCDGYQVLTDAYANGEHLERVYLHVTDDEEKFREFFTLRHRRDGQAVTFPKEGVLLSEKMASMLQVKQGDEVEIRLPDERRITVTVADIVENYVYHYCYMSEDYYEKLTGEKPEKNILMVRYAEGEDTDGAADRLSTALMQLEGVTSYSRIDTIREQVTESMNSINYSVIIIILSAAALAFVVLYNLTNINITERKRELATLKVLGFQDGETAAYVYRETIVLTGLGIAAGLVAGGFLHAWLITTVEVSYVMFGRTVSVHSYVYAALLTAVFSLMVNVMARSAIARIDMVESLKSVE